MTAYYPSQAGYPVSQPMAHPYGMPGSYAHPGGMMYVPSHAASHRSRRHRYRNSYPSYDYGYGAYSGPQVMSALPAVGGPMMMQPSYGHYGHYNPFSFANRFRQFLGLAPRGSVRYKSNRSTWGFMGYSRRQRYIDAATGVQVTRDGRPVYTV